MKIFNHYLFFIKEREVRIMAMIYVTLIIKGLRTYKDVPKVIRAKVKELLIQLELEELIVE